MVRNTRSIARETYILDRGFRWIGPFFGMQIPPTIWAFFISDTEPENVTGGLLAVGVQAFFAVFCHLTWRRTRVLVDPAGIAIRGLTGERQAAWREVKFAVIEGPDLVFHLVTGRPLKASTYLANFPSLVQLVDELGMLRSSQEAV